jgi:HEAT repeat protein
MTMPEVVTCPQCRKTVQIPQHLLGTSVKCPACGGRFTAALGNPRRAGDPGRSGDKAPWWIFALIGSGLAVLLLLLACGSVGFFVWQVSRGVSEVARSISPPANLDEALAALQSEDVFRKQFALSYLEQSRVDEHRRAEVVAALTPLYHRADPATHDPAGRALARWAGKDDAPLLLKMLDEPSGSLRHAVVEALGRLKEPKAAAPIARMLPDFFQRDLTSRALAAIGPPAEKEVVKYYFDNDLSTREEARKLLAGYGTQNGVILTQAVVELRGSDQLRRQAVVEWLAQVPPEEDHRAAVAAALDSVLTAGDPWLREAAIRALRGWVTRDNVPTLVNIVGEAGFDPHANSMRESAMSLLGRLKDERGAEAVAARLPDVFAAVTAEKALSNMGPVAEKAVTPYLTHNDAQVRERAWHITGAIGTKESLPALKTLAAKESDYRAGPAAQNAVAAIQRRD